MKAVTRKNPFLVFLGDVAILFLSLWLMLLVRYMEIPGRDHVMDHLVPFSILFVVWFVVFYIAGLYEKRVFIFKQRLPGIIVRVQIINSIIAVLFFYFIPYYGITPKTNLFIYLLISSLLILGWRVYGYSLFGSKEKQSAILIARGNEMKELYNELNTHDHYNLHFVAAYDADTINIASFKEEIRKKVVEENVEIMVVDFNDSKIEPVLPALYSLMFSKVIFVDMHKMYEDVFDRIPLSIIKYDWFLENISLAPKVAYDLLKRIMDIVISIPVGLISLIGYPFIILAIKRHDNGPVFITQQRIGQNGELINTYKFRSMQRNETDLSKGGDNKVTPFGAFMRKTRIDELPQLWNVIRGDLSLIGPRPELPTGVALYEKEIPYYTIRHLIKPGLSGWAQIYHDNHPHHGFGVEQTKEKLSYDLYYLKNRSLWLDIKIALKTIKKLLSRSGV